MANQRYVSSYAALEQHRSEMRTALRQGRWRLGLVLLGGLALTTAAYWIAPALALLVSAAAILAGFFAAITGSSSVPADQMTGAEGEEKVLRMLEGLPDNYTIFNQLQVPDASLPSGQREIDFLVVGPGGLHVIEVKNVGGLIYVRPDQAHWPIAHKAGCGGRPGWNAMVNPLAQVRAQAAALDRWLIRNGLIAAIYPMVCFARSNVGLQDRDLSPVPVVAAHELLDRLTRSSPAAPAAVQTGLVRLLSSQRKPEAAAFA